MPLQSWTIEPSNRKHYDSKCGHERDNQPRDPRAGLDRRPRDGGGRCWSDGHAGIRLRRDVGAALSSEHDPTFVRIRPSETRSEVELKKLN